MVFVAHNCSGHPKRRWGVPFIWTHHNAGGGGTDIHCFWILEGSVEEERSSFVFQLIPFSQTSWLGMGIQSDSKTLSSSALSRAEEDKVLLSEAHHHFLVGKARGGENKDGCPSTLGEVNFEKSTWWWLGRECGFPKLPSGNGGLWAQSEDWTLSHDFRWNLCFPFGNYMCIVSGLKDPACRPLSRATSRLHQVDSGYRISSVVSSLVTRGGEVIRSRGKLYSFR